MRFLYARFKGYAGIYNGLGLDEIKIDFTKCKHKLIIICGKNGSGKSTIENALHPNPDPSSSFIHGMVGEKELVIQHGDSIYNILITHPITKSGDRGQTKAIFCKNGEELNPNGNISSYKDMIYNEFSLDPNFIALSKLSGTDRGLADKSPAERKKFVNSIIECLEVYNDINKTLSKKHSIFKSHINGLIGKIRNIGSIDSVQNTLTGIENRMLSIRNEKSAIDKEITKSESIVTMLDPTSEIQNVYQAIYDELKIVNSEMEKNKAIIDKVYDSCGIQFNIDDLDKQLATYSSLVQDGKNSLAIKESNLSNTMISYQEQAKVLSTKQQRVDSIKSEFDYDALKNTVISYREKVKEQESVFSSIGVSDFNMSKDDLIFILETLQNIKESIDVFKSTIDSNDSLSTIISMINDGISLESLRRNINNDMDKLHGLQLELANYSGMISSIGLLNSRPKECKINDCFFIKDALNNIALEPENKVCEIEKSINELKLYIEEEHRIVDTYTGFNNILNMISSNSMMISKVPISKIFTDKDLFFTKIINGSRFEEINDVYKYIQFADMISDYNQTKDTLRELESDLKIYDNKILVLNELIEELEDLSIRVDEMYKNIESANNEIRIGRDLLYEQGQILSSLSRLHEAKSILDNSVLRKNQLKDDFFKIKEDMGNIKSHLDTINTLQSRQYIIIEELKPLQEERDRLKFCLNTLDSYNEDLAKYKDKADIIETLKKYSSPNSGIQTLFIKLYMNETLTLANELLGYLFNGEMRLEPYIINQNEFRIPCSGSGMLIDDISSCSTSQICMIGMILSLVLMRQASMVYNIVRLDEIDGGLDSHNRTEFVNVINLLIEKMEIDQLFLISHSIEMEMSNVDIILLNKEDGETDIPTGNIIFDIREEMRDA